MYKISPSDARTDLYGINKGTAQVFDHSIAANNLERVAAERDRQGAAKRKQQQQLEGDVYGDLDSLNKLSVLDRERPMFAEKQANLYNNVKKNIDKIRNGDTNALLAFKQELSSILTAAELSKNTREQIEAAAKSVLTDGPYKYRPESLKYIEDYATNPERNGVYDFNPTSIKENFNYNERVIKELSPYAQRMATDSPLKKVFTKQQAEELIADDLTDPVIFEQATYDFNKASDRMGAKTPIEYYQRKYAPNLIVNDTKEPYYTGFGDKSNRPKVNGTYTDEGNGKGEFQFEYTNTTDNPYLTIKDPKTGGAVEVKPIKVLFNGKNTVLQAATKSTKDEDGNEIPAKTVTLDYNYVSDVMHNKFGINNVYDIQKGNAPSHVNVKRSDVSDKNKKVSEVERKTRDGRVAVFNSDTKEFIRWK